MPEYVLTQGIYLAPTPAGAYHAVAHTHDESARRLLLRLLALPQTPALTQAQLQDLSQLGPDAAQELLYRMQTLHLLQGLETPRTAPTGALENLLPGLLASLAGRNKALLADSQGFYLVSHGFHHETAEELAGLSADLGNLHERHQGLIAGNLALQTSAWALINAGGNNEVGFWPIYVGSQRFVLVMTGLPHFNQPALIELVWILIRRYGQ